MAVVYRQKEIIIVELRNRGNDPVTKSPPALPSDIRSLERRDRPEPLLVQCCTRELLNGELKLN